MLILLNICLVIAVLTTIYYILKLLASLNLSTLLKAILFGSFVGIIMSLSLLIAPSNIFIIDLIFHANLILSSFIISSFKSSAFEVDDMKNSLLILGNLVVIYMFYTIIFSFFYMLKHRMMNGQKQAPE